MIWVDYNNSVIDRLEKNKSPNENVFYKMNGKKIKIRGIVYADDHGHLSQYAGSIKYICYLEVFD